VNVTTICVRLLMVPGVGETVWMAGGVLSAARLERGQTRQAAARVKDKRKNFTML
jgi:hypothetical protein